MKYTARYYGAPCAEDGEQGPETSTPATLARETLHAGQRLDFFRLSDEAQTTPIRRWQAGATGATYEVTL